MSRLVDDYLATLFVDIRKDTVGSPLELSISLAIPNRVIPITRGPKLVGGHSLQFLSELIGGLAIQRLERLLEAGRKRNVVGHGN